jgi:hypothetical protein
LSDEFQCFVGKVRITKPDAANRRDRGAIQIPVDLVEYLDLKDRDYVKVLIKKLVKEGEDS